MAKLSSSSRSALPKTAFGMPGQKKYPMPDKSHVANAKARATQQVKAGNISPSTKSKIDAKANSVMKKNPGMTKTKTSQMAQRIRSRISARSKKKTQVGFD